MRLGESIEIRVSPPKECLAPFEQTQHVTLFLKQALRMAQSGAETSRLVSRDLLFCEDRDDVGLQLHAGCD